DLTDTYGPEIVGRLKSGITIERAQAELTVLYRQILSARGSTQTEEQQRREHAEQRVDLTPAGNGSGMFQPQERSLLLIVMSSVAATLIFGMVPAVRATKADLASTLKAGGRGVAGGRGWEAGKVLVAAQVALSLLLLVCAGLLVRSVRNLQAFDPGFDRERLY